MSDARIAWNAKQAQKQGYAIVCAYCGVGIYIGPYDGSTEHDPECPRRPQ